jgi:hypothetical protein
MANQTNLYGERAERMRELTPAFFAELRLYATEDGGRKQPAYLGWCCPCFLEKVGPKTGAEGWANPPIGYDACPLLGDKPMHPGESRRVGFVALSEQSIEALVSAGHFYLWDGGFVGEAQVVIS